MNAERQLPAPLISRETVWDLPVTTIKGISRARATQLERLDIHTVGELASHFPRRYEDWTSVRSICDLQDGHEEVFLGMVKTVPTIYRKGKRSTLQTNLHDPSGTVKAYWFNQAYFQDKLQPGCIYLFRGRVKREARRFFVANPSFELQHLETFPDSGTPAQAIANTFIRPIYPTTQGLGQTLLRHWVEQALAKVRSQITDYLPTNCRKDNQLAERLWAYDEIHNPSQFEHYGIARRRLAFDELLLMQLALRKSRSDAVKRAGNRVDLNSCPHAAENLRTKIKALPFQLTEDQKACCKDVFNDMNSEVGMNRLIQGDVGSGKTIVAFLAMCAAGLVGKQAVLMVPTSILAAQHELSFRRLFPDIPSEQILCLTGKQSAREKRDAYAGLESGQIRYIIGTHALLQSKVRFRDLALAVTDEQHRFGVKQRLSLIEGSSSHVLVMSATPIPRTLALILYGDLNVSCIRQKPPGRQPIKTYTARTKDLPRIWAMVHKFAQAGQQTYIVCPMVNENEDNDLESAILLHQKLQEGPLSRLRVGLVHGKLKENDKNEIMEAFQRGEIQVLVATTVIEVGVDNPNASLMLIMNAERFGLASLHQLRGRIGRGAAQSLCILQSDVGEGLARERMTALCRSEDGFVIAEEDLKLRGPGDFFGTRQHGLPAFRVANLYEDQTLLQAAGELCERILAEDPELRLAENKALSDEIERFLRQRTLSAD